MKLIKIYKNILKEEAYVQKPTPSGNEDDKLNIFKSPQGYVTTNKTVDPSIEKTSWDLAPEPQLLAYARELGKMKRDLMFYEMLDSEEAPYNLLKLLAHSIRTSLANAEGKVRDLYKKQQQINKLSKK